MPKPSFYPDWCTSAPVTNPTSGQKNYDETVSPPIPVPVTQNGFGFKEFPPRQWYNLMFRWIGQWVRWLEGENTQRAVDLTDHHHTGGAGIPTKISLTTEVSGVLPNANLPPAVYGHRSWVSTSAGQLSFTSSLLNPVTTDVVMQKTVEADPTFGTVVELKIKAFDAYNVSPSTIFSSDTLPAAYRPLRDIYIPIVVRTDVAILDQYCLIVATTGVVAFARLNYYPTPSINIRYGSVVGGENHIPDIIVSYVSAWS